jgi:hypothetical protein
MSNNKNKSLVLGSSTFNFIANMASRSLSTRGDLDFSSDCSGTTDTEKDKKHFGVNSEEETTCKSTDITHINQTEFLAEFKTELNITYSESSENKSLPRFDFKLLSQSQSEYEINSTLGRDNFLKGCKW